MRLDCIREDVGVGEALLTMDALLQRILAVLNQAISRKCIFSTHFLDVRWSFFESSVAFQECD